MRRSATMTIRLKFMRLLVPLWLAALVVLLVGVAGPAASTLTQRGSQATSSASADAAVSSWRALGAIPGAVNSFEYPFMVSCPRAGFCMVTNGKQEFIWHDGAWTAIASPPKGYFVGISCSSPEFCMDVYFTNVLLRGSSDGSRFVRDTDYGVIWNGRSWGKPHEIASVRSTEFVVGYLLVRSVSCTGAAFCMTVGGSFSSAVWNGLSWKEKRGMTTGTDGGANVSCATSDFCVDVPAEAPYTLMWDGRSWRDQPMSTSVPRTSPGSLAFNEVSCGSTSFCAATVNKSLPWLWKGRLWQGSELVGQGYAVDVSCSSKDFCAVADTGGTARTWNGRSWSSAIFVGNASPDAEPQVSCSRGDTCMLVDEADAYLYAPDHA